MADKDLVKLLSKEHFNPGNYVQELSRQTDGAAETFTSTRDQVSCVQINVHYAVLPVLSAH